MTPGRSQAPIYGSLLGCGFLNHCELGPAIIFSIHNTQQDHSHGRLSSRGQPSIQTAFRMRKAFLVLTLPAPGAVMSNTPAKEGGNTCDAEPHRVQPSPDFSGG
ncbi:hypothetical protein V2G26_003029 [Clonostachys chloroleuca]